MKSYVYFNEINKKLMKHVEALADALCPARKSYVDAYY